MNTPAHLIFGAAAFARPDRKGALAAACLGALAPDLSLYLLGGVSIFLLGIPPETVFREYYFSDSWQAVFAVDNSFVLWGLLLGIALWRRWPLVQVFAAAGLLHLALDFPLHTEDARKHFWPLSDWIFHGPFSYWDRRAHAGIFGPMEAGLSVLLAGLLLWRYRAWTPRLLIAVLLAMELYVARFWLLIF
ncbi:MAG: cobalamin biosynthesis protein CobQ [Silicimonas sp.]|nr:cobalamin biosynthesis protein CobQ [Silicimonas sp.]